jgi:hypothetical protein
VTDVRGSLAKGLADAVTPEKIKELVDAALSATKKDWATITCKHCNRVGKYQVEITDARAAAQALALLTDQGLGKTVTAPPPEKPVPVGTKLEALSDDELHRIIAEG